MASQDDKHPESLHRLSLIINQLDDFSVVLGHISHDLSSPIGAIRLFLDIEKARQPENTTPRSLETFSRLADEADAAKELIDRLVEFKDSLALLASPIVAPCPIGDLVESFVHFCQDKDLFRNNALEYQDKSAGLLTPDWDASMLRHSLLIICRDFARLVPPENKFFLEVSSGLYSYQISIFASGLEVPNHLLGIRPQQLRHKLLVEHDKKWHPTAQVWTEVNAMARLFDASWSLNWDAEGHASWSLKPLSPKE